VVFEAGSGKMSSASSVSTDFERKGVIHVAATGIDGTR